MPRFPRYGPGVRFFWRAGAMQPTVVESRDLSEEPVNGAARSGADAAPAAGALPLVVSIVGIDGCGKDSTFDAALRQ